MNMILCMTGPYLKHQRRGKTARKTAYISPNFILKILLILQITNLDRTWWHKWIIFLIYGKVFALLPKILSFKRKSNKMNKWSPSQNYFNKIIYYSKWKIWQLELHYLKLMGKKIYEIYFINHTYILCF